MSNFRDDQIFVSLALIKMKMSFCICELHIALAYGWNPQMLQPLALARDQSKGLRRCGPRMKPMSHISCSREWENVRE